LEENEGLCVAGVLLAAKRGEAATSAIVFGRIDRRMPVQAFLGAERAGFCCKQNASHP